MTTEYEDPNGVTQKKDYEFTIESYDNIKNIALPSYPHYTYSAWKFNGNVSLSSTALFNWFEANPGQTKVTATSNRTINKYTLGFVDNEGRIAANSITDITILNYKEKLATLPTPPNKKHYTPASQWTLNGAPYEIEALMTAFLSNSTQTLVMDYTPVTYTLTFIDFKGNVVGEPIEFDITSDLDALINRFPTVPSVPNEDPYIYKYAVGTEYWDIAKEDIFSDEYYNENRTLSREVKVNATLIVYDKIVVNGTEHPVEEGFTYDDIEKIVENVISETDSEYDSNWFKLITEFSVDENGVITATSRKDALSFNIVFKDENGNVIPETTITFTYYERMDPITYPDYKRAGYDVTWNWNPAYNSVTGLAPTNYEVSAVLTPSTTPPQTDPIETPPVVTPPETTPEQTPPASTPEGTTTDPGQVEPAPEKNMNWLWWTLLAILILAIVGCVLYIILFAKKNDDDDDDTPEPEPELEPEPMPEPKPEPAQHHAFIPILEDVAADEVDDILTDEDALSEIIESDEVGGTGKKMYVNIGRICLEYEAGETVDIESLKERKLLSPKAGRVKILADGHLDKALTVKADDFSAQAVKMILLTGGTVIHLK